MGIEPVCREDHRVGTEEGVVQAPVRQVLVHDELLRLLQADPNKLHKVPVRQLGGEDQLVLQLVETLRGALGEPFHRNDLSVLKPTLTTWLQLQNCEPPSAHQRECFTV
jgi:hypothetical protein